ncbi:hypothetical protein [Nisaea sp.]|uniref:hypothetical protein n=1 Tax=Nisaea sp. TaxID=2024842 RepID=UPI002B2759F6|nr:hypothetical protein [Nisaea sp.]
MSEKRSVEPVPEFRAQVREDFVSPSVDCVAGAYFLLEELEERDPDLDERCGLLANCYEIFALAIPKCSEYALVVSLDISGDRPWPCVVHGLLRRNSSACDAGRRRATTHFKLINPSWESSHG